MINAYITDGSANKVSVIDTTTNTISATINVGHTPGGIAVAPDGNTAYVTNAGAATVSVINTATNTVSKTITVANNPQGVAISPDGTKAFVANFGSNNISVINTATGMVSGTITLGAGNGPLGVATRHDGTKAYVTNGLAGTVSVIDIATNSISATVTVGSGPSGVAVTPDDTKVLVTNENSNTLSVIDTASNTVSATISVGSDPHAVAITPDGATAYVTNELSDNVSVIDIASNTISATITVGTHPIGVAITPDGTTAYVANQGSNNVSVISTAHNTVSATIPTGNSPTAFGIFIQPPSIPMTTIYAAPQGRLTLTSNTPVMTANATAQTSVYYTPYQGNIVPIYDGANMDSYTFGQLTMTLNTGNQTSGNIYDLFVFLNSSVVTIGAGPAWSSSSSRGSGAGTTQLQQTDGLWVNANSITLKNGTTSYSSIAVGEATYVGSIYMTANGQTGMSFNPAAAAGGTNNFLGVYNAYNRVTTTATASDSNASWTYVTATWRPADGSSSNTKYRVSFVDGLQQSSIRATYVIEISVSTASEEGAIGINLDSTTASPVTPIGLNESTLLQNVTAYGRFMPQLGLHYVQAMEYAGGMTVTYTANGTSFNGLMVELEM